MESRDRQHVELDILSNRDRRNAFFYVVGRFMEVHINKCARARATSAKRQAASNKPQATSSKHQAASYKHRCP